MIKRTEPWPIVWAREGCFNRWFDWIQALGLTSGLFALAMSKATWWPAQAALVLLGILSAIYVFFWALGWLLPVLFARIPKLTLHPTLARYVAAIIAFPLVASLMWFLGAVFAGFLQ